MNITHAESELVQGDRLQAIFTRQRELMEKYHHIESASGLCQTDDCPINLDDKRGQARIKDFAWRITEELGEALDAMEHPEHYIEELIDGLHFLTELTILAGLDYDTIVEQKEKFDDSDMMHAICVKGMGITLNSSISFAVANFITQIGMMCNCLKNKPWKQTHMKTDKNAFYERLRNTWAAYFGILFLSDLDPDEITDIYLKKSQVNKFRQRSNY